MNDTSLKELKSLWDKFVPHRYLLTLKDKEHVVNEFFTSMKSLGLSKKGFIIMRNEKKSGGFWDVCKDIYLSHWKAASDASQKVDENSAVGIFEDDCRPLTSDDSHHEGAVDRLLQAFRYIKNLDRKDWQILNLGSVSFGPIFKIKDQPLVNTSLPFASQSYIINGYYLKRMLKEIDQNHWKIPWSVEMFITVPARRKFAVYPNVTRQCVIPRAQKVMFGDTSFHDFATTSHRLMFFLPWILLAIFIILIVVIVTIWFIKIKSTNQRPT